MSAIDKAKDKAQEVAGKGKQAVGGATSNDGLKAEGVKDEKAGQIKGVGDKVKDVFTQP